MALKNIWYFFKGTLVLISKGSKAYYCWVFSLLVLMAIGGAAYIHQLSEGLIVTAMRDQVSWGFYIANFTFLVGVAAAAVLLVIPAYVYHWEPIKEIAVLGELLAVSAIVMCLLFVTVDIGRPDRFWHLIPKIGLLNFPQSLLAWDVVVLNVYLVLNLSIAVYILYNLYYKREPNKNFTTPLLLLIDPVRHLHPHRDRLSLQRTRRPALLELLDPGAALSRLRLLLRSGLHDPDLLPGAQIHPRSRSRTRPSRRWPN